MKIGYVFCAGCNRTLQSCVCNGRGAYVTVDNMSKPTLDGALKRGLAWKAMEFDRPLDAVARRMKGA